MIGNVKGYRKREEKMYEKNTACRSCCKAKGKGIQILKEDSGLSVIEMLLILVVIIALVLIFKTQLIDLVNTIFDKIASESSGI